MSKASSSPSASGHALWTKTPKANAELFALTYGSLIQELIADYQTVPDIHQQLDKMGYSMGVRCIDELLAKSESISINIGTCASIQQTAEIVSKTGFRFLLGINVDFHVVNDTTFSLLFTDNPLALFVELPPSYKNLQYSRLYCGVIKGALEQINLKVECDFAKDMLQGDDTYELVVVLKQVLVDGAGDDYKEE